MNEGLICLRPHDVRLLKVTLKWKINRRLCHTARKQKQKTKLNIINAYCAYLVANNQETVQSSRSCQEFVHLDVSLNVNCLLTPPPPLLLSQWPDSGQQSDYLDLLAEKEWSAGVLMQFDALSHLNSTFALTLLWAGDAPLLKVSVKLGSMVWQQSLSGCLHQRHRVCHSLCDLWPIRHRKDPTQWQF